MPILQFVSDSFDMSRLATLTADEVKFLIALRLPFRLRFDKLVRFACDVDGPCEVSFRNNVSLPRARPDEMYRHGAMPGDLWPLWTNAAIVLHKPRTTPEKILHFLRGQDKVLQDVLPWEDLKQAREAMNRTIIAYCTAVRQLFGIRLLRPLNVREFLDSEIWDAVLLGYRDEEVPLEDVFRRSALWPQGERDFFSIWSGDFSDIPDIDIARIQSLVSSHEENLHHELALLAKNSKVEAQYPTALVLAVAALETVHGAFIHEVLATRLPDEVKDREALINDFMREQGFYTVVRISPYLFLNEEERPSREDVDRCTKAIEIRNAVMHGLTRKGKHKMRNYTFDDYENGYKGALALFRCFSDALDRRRGCR